MRGEVEIFVVECWRSLEKLMEEAWRNLGWKEKERKKIGKENKKGRYFGGVLEKLGET